MAGSKASTGLIMAFYDPFSTFHKSVFGPVAACCNALFLRITSQHRLHAAKFHLNFLGDGSTSLLMTERQLQDVFVYECHVPSTLISHIGIYAYYFSHIQGGEIVKIGQDPEHIRGAVEGSAVPPFKLTVYQADFKVPDWFKEQCFYHIFVDSFYSSSPKGETERSKMGYLKVNDGKVEQNCSKQLLHFHIDFDSPETTDKPPHYMEKGRGMLGGDLLGIQRKLDYLQDLGVTSIYLSPVFYADSSHKYNANDFMSIDPHFGVEVKNKTGSGLDMTATTAANDVLFSSFCAALDRHGMYVILDGVFNHCGANSIYFDRQNIRSQIGAYPFWSKTFDLAKSENLSIQEAKAQTIHHYEASINPDTGRHYQYPQDFSFIDLFDIEGVKMPSSDIYEYHAWAGYTSLPCFARQRNVPGDADGIEGLHVWNNLAYRQYFYGGTADSGESVVNKWARLGIAGWRMDATPEISIPSWRKIAKAVQSVGEHNGRKPQVMIGEVWQKSPQYLLGDTYQSLTNYPLKDIIDAFVFHGDGAHFQQGIEQIKDMYPGEAFHALFNMLSSHDTNRLFHTYNSGRGGRSPFEMMACAYGLLFTLPGVPVIYYGDEIGMDGERDPDNRRPFPWAKVTEKEGTFTLHGAEGVYHTAIKRFLAARKSIPALVHGNLTFLHGDACGVVFLRTLGHQCVIVAGNPSNQAQTIRINVAKLPKNIIVPANTLIHREDDHYLVKIPATSTQLVTLNNQAHQQLTPVAFISSSGEEIQWSAVDGATGYRIYGARSPFDLTQNHYSLLTETSERHIRGLDPTYKHILITPFNAVGEHINAVSVCIGDDVQLQPIDNHLAVTASATHFSIKTPTGVRLFRGRCEDQQQLSCIELPNKESSYQDHDVDSRSAYQYVLLDAQGHVYQSAPCKLKTDFIDIVINAHIPEYTPSDELITMIHRGNGWCLKEAPLQKISPTLHQYTTKGRVGDRFEAINFCRRQSGFCASVIYLSGIDKDPNCSSNWAYFDFDTHVSTTVQETQPGRFVYDVYIHRWIDIPIADVTGRFRLGDTPNFTANASETVLFSIPRDTRLFVNDTEVPVDVLSDTALVHFPLSEGENRFMLHLELLGRHTEKYGFKESKYQGNIVRPAPLIFVRSLK